MLEIGLFHNGASSLPIVTGKDGVTFNDGSLKEVHRAAQETLVNQVRQGILAEKLGFQSFWMTEHHFQPEGAEMSPNPVEAVRCAGEIQKAMREREGSLPEDRRIEIRVGINLGDVIIDQAADLASGPATASRARASMR